MENNLPEFDRQYIIDNLGTEDDIPPWTEEEKEQLRIALAKIFESKD